MRMTLAIRDVLKLETALTYMTFYKGYRPETSFIFLRLGIGIFCGIFVVFYSSKVPC